MREFESLHLRHYVYLIIYECGERMKFNTNNIEYVETLRLSDVIESTSDNSKYYTDEQVKTLAILYKLVNPQYFELIPRVDRTIKLETIVDTYIQLVISPDGLIHAFEASR